ncbi:hotdog domain-containing protein [Pseudooceanicola algae]|uniref:Uncharacterized protein n=1 Tax=Pseudooceanicola algae TaxID=1537215 RepID=A0A418SKZ5_9RHOB|nr:hotdog domain-containing protein [Pseudooceanicola algae]QPM90905.1 hypothetical protein PSAL_021470 [Pseudooceanicola algae]
MTDLGVGTAALPVLMTMAPLDAVTPRGAVTGGWMLTQLDLAAGLAGRRASGGEALILSIKDLTFRDALRAGEDFQIRAELTRKGNTSFNLLLSAWAGASEPQREIFQADVLMVAVDAEGTPRKLL